MSKSEILNLDSEAIKLKKQKIQGELVMNSFKNSLGQVSNPLVIRKLRREYARLCSLSSNRSKVMR